MEKLIAGIDIGGTKVAGGLVNKNGKLLKAVTVPTEAAGGFEKSFGQILNVIEQLISQAGGRERLQGVA